MRIGFDSSAQETRTTGAGEYQRQLVASLPGAARDLDLVVYAARGLRPAVTTPRTEVREMPWAPGDRVRRILYGGLAWRRHWRADGLDLLHVPFYYLPPGAPRRNVVTVYDARFLRYPETYPRARLAFLRMAVPWSLRRAAHIIAISEFTKSELVELLGLPPERISVTLLAPRAEFARETDDDRLLAVRQRYRLPPRFILCAGTLEPRKNLARVVEAFARLRAQGLADALVLAGFRYFGAGSLEAAIQRLGVQSDVHLIGYVEDVDMPALYSLADLFVYPSLYEGFGIPPLEAMACGTPVVASNTTSIPEVAGTAAELVNPREVDSMVEGMGQVLGDPARASRLREAGRKRVHQFSWAETARQTVAVYRRILGGGA